MAILAATDIPSRRTAVKRQCRNAMGSRQLGPSLARGFRSPRPPEKDDRVVRRQSMPHQRLDRFVVDGGHPIAGTIAAAGNKNEALPVLAASLLVMGEVVVDNVPRIEDVSILLEALQQLGVAVRW